MAIHVFRYVHRFILRRRIFCERDFTLSYQHRKSVILNILISTKRILHWPPWFLASFCMISKGKQTMLLNCIKFNCVNPLSLLLNYYTHPPNLYFLFYLNSSKISVWSFSKIASPTVNKLNFIRYREIWFWKLWIVIRMLI